MAKLHAELSLTLRTSTQLTTEAKHAVQTTIRVDGKVLRTNLCIVDNSVTLVQQTNNGTLELVGRGDGRLHQGLKYLWRTGLEGFAEGLLLKLTH